MGPLQASHKCIRTQMASRECERLLKSVTSLPHTWASSSEAGGWRWCDAGRSPDTSPPACFPPPPCWCTSRCRGPIPGCRGWSQWRACWRESEPIRCQSWWSSVAPCLPLSVRRKDPHEEVQFTSRGTPKESLSSLRLFKSFKTKDLSWL